MRFCVPVPDEPLLVTTPTDMTTCSPASRPEVISVVPSPFKPVTTLRVSSTPPFRTFTVLIPPTVEMAADGTETTPSRLAETTETLAVMPGFTPAGTESKATTAL